MTSNAKMTLLKKVALVFIALIALLHLYIAWLEVFAWETRGPKVFSSLAEDLFSRTVAMAANQGLYNAFLAVGLFWSLLIKDERWQSNVAICFLLFVFVAGVFGAATVTTGALVMQSIPAGIALLLLYFSARKND